jgi:hypothetical protein
LTSQVRRVGKDYAPPLLRPWGKPGALTSRESASTSGSLRAGVIHLLGIFRRDDSHRGVSSRRKPRRRKSWTDPGSASPEMNQAKPTWAKAPNNQAILPLEPARAKTFLAQSWKFHLCQQGVNRVVGAAAVPCADALSCFHVRLPQWECPACQTPERRASWLVRVRYPLTKSVLSVRLGWRTGTLKSPWRTAFRAGQRVGSTPAILARWQYNKLTAKHKEDHNASN